MRENKCFGQIAEEWREWFSVHSVILRESDKSRCKKIFVQRANFF